MNEWLMHSYFIPFLPNPSTAVRIFCEVPMRRKKPKFGPEVREACGVAAHRAFITIRENEKAAGIEVPEADLKPWDQLEEAQKEVFRKSGEDLNYGETPSEQAFWNELERRRAEMGEKAFRAKVFEITIDEAIRRIAPNLNDAEHYRAVHVIVGLAGMLEVPEKAKASAP